MAYNLFRSTDFGTYMNENYWTQKGELEFKLKPISRKAREDLNHNRMVDTMGL